jgi:hypothetical protein
VHFISCFNLSQNQRLLLDQQKYIDTLQQELVRLRKRLTQIEHHGIVEPSILFTRLDAERNEQTLKKAVNKGKVPDTIYSVNMRTMITTRNIVFFFCFFHFSSSSRKLTKP